MKLTIDDLKTRTERVQLDDVDFDSFRDDPLDPDALRCLRYMHDVEHHTVCYLRDLRDDVLSALGNLGYQRSAAEKSVDRVLKTNGAPATFEALLRDVLKVMAG